MPESNTSGTQTAPVSNRGKKSKYPDHPLAWLTLYSDRLKRVQQDIFKLVQTPQGIELLKNWIPPVEGGEEDGSMTKKMRQVIKVMRSSPEMETEVFEYVKMKARIGSPSKARKKKQPA